MISITMLAYTHLSYKYPLPLSPNQNIRLGFCLNQCFQNFLFDLKCLLPHLAFIFRLTTKHRHF